jgi:hypothetical protein
MFNFTNLALHFVVRDLHLALDLVLGFLHLHQSVVCGLVSCIGDFNLVLDLTNLSSDLFLD